jgi:hypothetical protein
VADANPLVNNFMASVKKYANFETIPASASLGSELPRFIPPVLAPERKSQRGAVS